MAQRPPRVPRTPRKDPLGPQTPAATGPAGQQTPGTAPVAAASSEAPTTSIPLVRAADAVVPREAPAAPSRARATHAPSPASDVVPSPQRPAALAGASKGAQSAAKRGLSAARQAAARGAGAAATGVRKAKNAVAEEISADLAGEHLPGGVRRRRKQDPEDIHRRLVERTALEGAIRDPGEGPRAAAPAAARATAPVPARALSTRVLALALILIIAGFMLFPAVTTYLRQSAELRTAQALLAQEKEKKEQLTAELERWDDPDYVRQQARERIQRFLPGEKRYVVIGLPENSTEQAEETVKPGEYRQGLPWGDGVWDSVVRSATP